LDRANAVLAVCAEQGGDVALKRMLAQALSCRDLHLLADSQTSSHFDFPRGLTGCGVLSYVMNWLTSNLILGCHVDLRTVVVGHLHPRCSPAFRPIDISGGHSQSLREAFRSL
jgi:hypothetical protein